MLLKTRFVRCFCSVLFGIRDSFSICRTVNPVPAPPQGGGRTEQEELWLGARASTEEGVRFGGWNELATNGAFAPPAALKSAACGANVTLLKQHVQQLLVTLLFLGGITDEHGVASTKIGASGPTASLRDFRKIAIRRQMRRRHCTQKPASYGVF